MLESAEIVRERERERERELQFREGRSFSKRCHRTTLCKHEDLLDSLERELRFKPQTKENLVLFVIPKLYIKYQNLKDELCLKRYDSS